MKRLTPATVTLLMLVVVGALITAYVARKLFAKTPVVAQVGTRLVPMAVADLEPGTIIRSEHLGEGPIRTDSMERDMLLSNRVIIGRTVKEPIKRAEAIRGGQLHAIDYKAPIEITDGMHAVTVGTGDYTTIVDGFISPGDFVDVHFSTSSSSDERYRGGFTTTLLKGVKVIGLNKQSRGVGSAQRSGNTVTLEVYPAQSNVLIEADKRGQITLTYNPTGKGTGGISVESEDRAYFDELLGLKPLPEPEKPYEMEFYTGSGRGVVLFQDGKRYYGSGLSGNGLRSGGRDYGSIPLNGRSTYSRGISDQQNNGPVQTISPETANNTDV